MCSWCNPVTRKQTKQWIQKYPPEWHTIYPGQIWMHTIMEQCFFLMAAFNLIVFLVIFLLYLFFSSNCMYACVTKKINLIFQPEHWRQQAAHLWGSYFCKFIQNTVSSAFSVKSRTYQSKNDGRGGTGCDKSVTPFEYTHTHIDSQGNEQSFQSQAEITKEYESIFSLHLISVLTIQWASQSLVSDWAMCVFLLFFSYSKYI